MHLRLKEQLCGTWWTGFRNTELCGWNGRETKVNRSRSRVLVWYLGFNLNAEGNFEA